MSQSKILKEIYANDEYFLFSGNVILGYLEGKAKVYFIGKEGYNLVNKYEGSIERSSSVQAIERGSQVNERELPRRREMANRNSNTTINRRSGTVPMNPAKVGTSTPLPLRLFSGLSV